MQRLFLYTLFVPDRRLCGRAEPRLIDLPVLFLLVQLQRPPVTQVIAAGIELAVIVVNVVVENKIPLAEVGRAADLSGLILDLGKGRHQNGHQ